MSAQQERSATLPEAKPVGCGTGGAGMSAQQERSAPLPKAKPVGCGTGGAA